MFLLVGWIKLHSSELKYSILNIYLDGAVQKVHINLILPVTHFRRIYYTLNSACDLVLIYEYIYTYISTTKIIKQNQITHTHTQTYIYIYIYITYIYYIDIYITFVIYLLYTYIFADLIVNLFHVCIIKTWQRCDKVKMEQQIKKMLKNDPNREGGSH